VFEGIRYSPLRNFQIEGTTNSKYLSAVVVGVESGVTGIQPGIGGSTVL
jgi:hypothetical protein